ncbi:MAG: hypothetical protein ACRDK2_08295 [Solirubrobacteraceae bacterium]
MPMTEQTDAIATALEQLEEDVRELSPRWLPRTDELRDFLDAGSGPGIATIWTCWARW